MHARTPAKLCLQEPQHRIVRHSEAMIYDDKDSKRYSHSPSRTVGPSGGRAARSTPNVRWVSRLYIGPPNYDDMTSLFLSSVEEHIFVPKTNQNAGFWPKTFLRYYPRLPQREKATTSRSVPYTSEWFLTPNIFNTPPPLQGSVPICDILGRQPGDVSSSSRLADVALLV